MPIVDTHNGYVFKKSVNASRVFISWSSHQGSNPAELQVLIRPGGDLSDDEQLALTAFLQSLKRLQVATGSRIVAT
ncbi:TPA_asm: hypothetical protein [ssRNA phage Zoerhiza.4_17]|uniref:Uncharacterized protein n=2 Tax=Leviviricetes TaxID=2842243 RepID=A0A8S5L302_9VIRU|nr:hypothetical protein QIO63_gp3 [ssRNA phage Zoerhiza.4_17]QDH88780.1 MAG: hypothetical protein H4Rhizo45198_000002 [Leviviridae sp.]DAD51733.1 TPA_asm: hypothetical protein [ssRNA phage Zoerhiza.4_17]